MQRNTSFPFIHIISKLVIVVGLAATVATVTGIVSSEGPGNYQYESIRGREVTIYGRGVYQDMSDEVAVQGIAQDYVTLFIALPLLLTALFFARKKSLRGLFLLAGTLNYLLVTYIFYITMGMYNVLFLVYAVLLGSSFFAFILSLLALTTETRSRHIENTAIFQKAGWFLLVNAVGIALLWLSVVLPPLLDGSIIPIQVEHYTTLIVQGLDLGLFLPICFVSGFLAVKKVLQGFIFTGVTTIFLTLLMTALTAKVIFMAQVGSNVIPVIFIMPSIAVIAGLLSYLLLRSIR
jgi:hypothetical protein